MRRILWLFALAALVLAGAWLATVPRRLFEPDDPRLAGRGDPAKGRLVFAAGDCGDCHATPGQTDRLSLGGGLALASPFGTFRPPNISSDRRDGIGSWDTADLANALIAGVSPEGAHYYPAFPYTSYTGISLDDVRDLMAYLRTLPAVAGKPPEHDLPLLFRIRRFNGFWKLLFFREGEGPDPSGATLRDRGAYLVESIGHCAECHSSRNMLGGVREATRFAGGTDPENVGFVPNITPERLGHWSEADIAELLLSGRTPDHGIVGSSMAGVVANTASLPRRDRDAIARYIKTLPRRPTPTP